MKRISTYDVKVKNEFLAVRPGAKTSIAKSGQKSLASTIVGVKGNSVAARNVTGMHHTINYKMRPIDLLGTKQINVYLLGIEAFCLRPSAKDQRIA